MAEPNLPLLGQSHITALPLVDPRLGPGDSTAPLGEGVSGGSEEARRPEERQLGWE